MADKGYVQGFNGVSLGVTIDVVAQDDTDGYVEGRFVNEGFLQYPLTYNVQVITLATGIIVDISDAVLLYNSEVTGGGNGYFRIEDGAATFALTAGQQIHIIASYARVV